jgi:hypothetical protein
MRDDVKRDIEQAINQSYNQLQGEWRDWLEVAKAYEHKIPYQDRLDYRHDTLIELYHARQRDQKPIPRLRAYRIASLMTALYWRKVKSKPTMLSLDADIELDDGEIVQLKDTIADDHAIDLEAWHDLKVWLAGFPMRLVQIGNKRLNGQALTNKERQYLWYWQKKQQKQLELS